MKESKKKNYKMLEEFVLVKNDNTPIFREADVKVRPIAIGKNGPEYEILDKEDNRIGLVNDEKIFIFENEYKETLKKRMGKMYDYLGFDKEELKIDIKQKLIEQDKKKKQQNNEERNYEDIEENLKDEKEKNEDADKNKKIQQNKKNPQKKEKVEKSESLTKKELNSYNNVQVTDFEFVADMINPNEYNIYDTYFVNKDGNFQMMAWNRYEKKYDKIEELTSKENKLGKLDTIEKNREETEIGRGTEVTYLNRFGDRVDINFIQLDSGEIEGRVSAKNREGDLENSDKGDLDKDGDVEGIKIRTALDDKNPNIKSFDHINEDMNVVKKENDINSDEINEGILNKEQIEEVIDEKIDEEVISEKDKSNVYIKLAELDNIDEITKSELEDIIDDVASETKEKDVDNDRSREDDEDDEWVPWKPRSH